MDTQVGSVAVTDCLLLIRVGPTTVTKADRLPQGLTELRFPEGTLFALCAVATMFGMTPGAMRVLVHRLKTQLSRPDYWQRRRRGDFRVRRRFTPEDLEIIARHVKGKLPPM